MNTQYYKLVIFVAVIGLVLTVPTSTHAQQSYEDQTSSPHPSDNPTYSESTKLDLPYEWEFDSSISYSSGDYGTPETTNTVYWPFTLTRLLERGDIGLTVPFLYQDGGPAVRSVSGRGARVLNSFLGSDHSESGVGDILLSGHYYFFDETAEAFNLNGFAQIKFPSADKNNGLGTGKFDETIGLESSKTLSKFWSLYLDTYYTFIGDPSFVDLDNEFAFDLGVGYDLNEKTKATLYYSERTALLSGQDNPRDITLGVRHNLDKNVSLYGNLGFGLSNGSPDTSVRVGMSYLM